MIGPAFEIDAVHEQAGSKGGMFFSTDLGETLRLFPEPVEKIQPGFRVSIGGPRAELDELKNLHQNSGALLTIISPSYRNRLSYRKGFIGMPSRIKMAMRRAIDKNYLRDALGNEIEKFSKMKPYEVARLFLDLAVDIISHFPSYEDTQDL